jgi:hypothetical protein
LSWISSPRADDVKAFSNQQTWARRTHLPRPFSWIFGGLRHPAGLSGLFVAVVLMLYNAIQSVVRALQPGVSASITAGSGAPEEPASERVAATR